MVDEGEGISDITNDGMRTSDGQVSVVMLAGLLRKLGLGRNLRERLEVLDRGVELGSQLFVRGHAGEFLDGL